MPGLLKSAPSQESSQPIVNKTTQNVFSETPTIHREFYNFFNISDDSEGRLKFVADWAMDGAKNLGEAIKKVRNLEIKLGQPSSGETRLSKAFNWLRLSAQVNSRESEKTESLATVKAKHQAKLAELKQNRDNRIAKIQDEINRIDQEYKKARTIYLRNVTNESKKIQDEYGSILSELKSMRDAYRGKK